MNLWYKGRYDNFIRGMIISVVALIIFILSEILK